MFRNRMKIFFSVSVSSFLIDQSWMETLFAVSVSFLFDQSLKKNPLFSRSLFEIEWFSYFPFFDEG